MANNSAMALYDDYAYGGKVGSSETLLNDDRFEIEIISNKLQLYIFPVIITLGTVTNILSIMVLLRKNMRKSTTMLYLCVLSFADLMVLYTGLLHSWVGLAFKVDMWSMNEFFCRVFPFLTYFMMDFSVWTLVAVTVDRCISLCLPLKSLKFKGKWNARIVICAYTSVLFAINCHFFWTSQITGTGDEAHCQVSPDSVDFIVTVWPWIDLCIVCAFPFIIMTVCSLLIIRQVTFSQRQEMIQRCTATVRHAWTSKRTRKRNLSETNRAQSITLMLLTVNMVFLVLTTPASVFMIVVCQWYIGQNPGNGSSEELDPDTVIYMRLVRTIVVLMMYLNHAINFFLYGISGRRFRREFRAMFKH